MLRWPEDSWTQRMSAARLKKAQALADERRCRGQACESLDCLQFSDLLQILLEHAEERDAFGVEPRAAIKRVIKEFESLRNNLANAQDIVTCDWAQIACVAQRIEILTTEA